MKVVMRQLYSRFFFFFFLSRCWARGSCTKKRKEKEKESLN